MTSLIELQALPRNGKPITQWSDEDQALCDVTREIAKILAQSDQPTTVKPITSQPATELPKDFSATSSIEQVFKTRQAKGTYSSKGSGRVWVILKDDWHNYLQNSRVEFLGNGEWIAKGICPGKGIRGVKIVHVGSEGDRIFQRMVNNNDFGGFDSLPRGYTIIYEL